MTAPELVELRTELIQTAAVIVSAVEDIDHGEANTERYIGGSHFAHADHEVLREIWEERRRQDLKWGPQHHRIADWLAIIGEEYGETCMAYVDDLLMPTILEQKRINPPKPVKWGKSDPADYGTPTTHTLTEREILAHADQRIIEGYAPPLTFEVDVEPVREDTDDKW